MENDPFNTYPGSMKPPPFSTVYKAKTEERKKKKKNRSKGGKEGQEQDPEVVHSVGEVDDQ